MLGPSKLYGLNDIKSFGPILTQEPFSRTKKNKGFLNNDYAFAVGI